MSGGSLSKRFDINHQALQLNVEGLTHEESLIQPPKGGNCLNWVVGHIVANRNFILGLLGEAPIWAEADAEPYRRGSPPIQDGARARRLESILEDCSKAQDRIRAALGRTSEQQLAQKRGDGTVGESLEFLHFHEAYHIGQTALLRRMAGKKGAIP